MKTTDFRLTADHVALCDLLKLVGLAGSGGEGKRFVADGAVQVDGAVEKRKTAKIRAGQTVDCVGVRIRVVGGE